MKIGMISDLHIDINSEFPVINKLCDIVKSRQLDILLVAGDISENVRMTLDAVELLNKQSGAAVYFVPGNHDMWDTGGPEEKGDTDKVYAMYSASPCCLCGKAIKLNESWTLFGDIGWYDYSFGSDKFSREEFDKMHYENRTWQDHIKNKWTVDNISKNQEMLDRLTSLMRENPSEHKILVTHMLVHPAFTVSRPGQWEYFNAFLGSSAYYNLCKEFQVDYAQMGHVHYRKVVEEGDSVYVCACLNYASEWRSNDYIGEIQSALYVLDVE